MRILITGVSKGLGRALAREFYEQGYGVAGCARSAEKVQSLRQEIPYGHFSEVDVTQESVVKAWSTQVLQDWGTPDILINNAAIINRNAPLWEIEEEEFSQILAINLGGVQRLIRFFLPAMMEHGSGVIVNLSSGWGRSTSPQVAPYCSTKWGIEGMTKALAQELPDGLAAVPLNPGIIDTEMLRSCFGETASAYDKPEDWAKKAVRVISGITSAHNGQSLSV